MPDLVSNLLDLIYYHAVTTCRDEAGAVRLLDGLADELHDAADTIKLYGWKGFAATLDYGTTTEGTMTA